MARAALSPWPLARRVPLLEGSSVHWGDQSWGHAVIQPLLRELSSKAPSTGLCSSHPRDNLPTRGPLAAPGPARPSLRWVCLWFWGGRGLPRAAPWRRNREVQPGGNKAVRFAWLWGGGLSRGISNPPNRQCRVHPSPRTDPATEPKRAASHGAKLSSDTAASRCPRENNLLLQQPLAPGKPTGHQG